MRSNIIIVLICLLLIGSVSIALQCTSDGVEPAAASQLARFSSYDELKKFVRDSAQSYSRLQDTLRLPANGDFLALSGGAEDAAGKSNSGDYSTTNIQVEGVDEADIVKTDGEFIYLVSDERIVIVKAYPTEEAIVLSEIEIGEKPQGIFLNQNKLVIIHGNWSELVVQKESIDEPTAPEEEMVNQTLVKVYDVSDKESPTLDREVSIDGQYFGSRMVGDYVYAVIYEPVYEHNEEISLPRIDPGSGAIEISASEIYRSSVPDSWHMFTTILAINTQNEDQEPASETLLLGGNSSIYVSPDNIYIACTKWGNVAYSEKTAIHRIHFENGTIEYQASGEVPGRVLNQFSMDEYRGFFRIATTTSSSWIEEATFENTSANYLYVLDSDLSVVGRLEDLAPGESIYSARFIGERCYLVTFEIIDPFFVIDLKDPRNPKVLGELKITGYSDYLHPYDENHIIGIGKETVATDQGNFAWYQGVKISLFNVSDVANPKEVAKYEIGDRGTDSPILRDHKALLFDKSKNLLVLPILLAEIDVSEYPGGITPDAYGEYVWQGAYVFDISLDEGLQLKGRISHYDSDTQLNEREYYFSSTYSVERSLYINDTLYTISEEKIKMNSLEDLAVINEVEIP